MPPEEGVWFPRARLAALSGVGLLLLAFLSLVGGNSTPTDSSTEGERSAVQAPGFPDLSLEARAAYVFDVDTGRVLFSLNSDAQLPLASLTKLMTAAVASDLLPDAAVVTIDDAALLTEGDSGLGSAERWSAKDLTAFTLMVSSNDGAQALSLLAGKRKKNEEGLFESDEGAFVRAMNEKAESLGLQQTYFLNGTGLDSSLAVAGGYGSAHDVAFLFSHLLREIPGALGATRHASLSFFSLDNVLHTATNTSDSLEELPGLIAAKTGFTDLAGGNLVIAFDAGLNHPIVAVVLGSTEEGRLRDIRKLVEFVGVSLRLQTE